MNRETSPSPRLDELDRRIIYELMADAWNTSPPAIAETLDVAPGTVRNRIRDLEAEGVIEGYHAHVNFERTNGRLTTLFLCNVPFADRETIARAAYEIPGVINVRVMMGGRRSFHVLAVGEDTADLRRIGTTLSELGVEIEDEMLVESDMVRAYAPFGGEYAEGRRIPADALHLSSRADLVEVTVEPDAPIASVPIADAIAEGILDEEPLVVSIERGDEMITPHGDTELQTDDRVTLFASGGVDETTIEAFYAPATPNEREGQP